MKYPKQRYTPLPCMIYTENYYGGGWGDNAASGLISRDSTFLELSLYIVSYLSILSE